MTKANPPLKCFPFSEGNDCVYQFYLIFYVTKFLRNNKQKTQQTFSYKTDDKGKSKF